jgi:hypothetical protein
MGNDTIDPDVRDKFFDEKDRAHGVAALHYVDKVFVYNRHTMEDIIAAIKPSVYVKGEEFSQKTDLIKNEIDLVEKNGGPELPGALWRAGDGFSFTALTSIFDLYLTLIFLLILES